MHLGLSTIQTLLTNLPHTLYTPHHHPTIHIAGSNGKGSTAHKLATTLTAHHLTTALYTSPHLSSWRERLAIDGQSISRDDVEQLLPPILAVAARLGLVGLTAFEVQTVLALVWFCVRRVDVAVVECGLGGRLDATNVITQPLLSILTSVSLEHTAILGPTTAHITREKAGIVKRGRPVVIGPTVDEIVLRDVVAEVGGGDVVRVTGTFNTTEAENVAVAKAALAVIRAEREGKGGELNAKVHERMGDWNESVIEQAMTARPPCRYERLTLPTTPPLPTILDVAHNPAAFARLIAAVQSDYPSHRIRAVVGMSSDKDIAACLTVLLPHVAALHLVTAASPRSASLDQLLAAVGGSGRENRAKVVVGGSGDVKVGVEAAVRACCEWNGRRRGGGGGGGEAEEEVLLVCGSFFIFRDVRPALGLHYPTDPIDLNESSLQPKGDQSGIAAVPDTAAASTRPVNASLASSHNFGRLSSVSHLPSGSTSTIQQHIRSISFTSSSASASSFSPTTTTPPRERTTKDLTLVPAGITHHRASVLSLYRHMLTLAQHFSSPLTVTPLADVRREFRAARDCGVEEARERLRVGRGQLAYLRTQVERVYWRSGEVVGEKDELRGRDQLADEQQSVGDVEFHKGYDRIFASSSAVPEAGGKGRVKESEVQRWVYDEAGEVLIELNEEERQKLVERDGAVGGRRVSNSQGLTDDQIRRDRALKERFSFRGPTWEHLRK